MYVWVSNIDRPSHSGQRHSRIIFDPILSQWNLTVANDPQLLAVSHAAMPTLVIGEWFFIPGEKRCFNLHQVHMIGRWRETWHAALRNRWPSKFPSFHKFSPQILSLALSSCSSSEFSCDNGFCIDILKRWLRTSNLLSISLWRCDNANDCPDKSDEADCNRVGLSISYLKKYVRRLERAQHIKSLLFHHRWRENQEQRWITIASSS